MVDKCIIGSNNEYGELVLTINDLINKSKLVKDENNTKLYSIGNTYIAICGNIVTKNIKMRIKILHYSHFFKLLKKIIH